MGHGGVYVHAGQPRGRGAGGGRSSTCRGRGCARSTATGSSGSTGPGEGAGEVADAAVCATPGCAIAVLTADCAPVVLDSPEGVFGVAHAGWVGLTAGVLERTVEEMRALGATESRAVLGRASAPSATSSAPTTSTGSPAAWATASRSTTAVRRPRPRPGRRRAGRPRPGRRRPTRRRRRLHRLLARPLLLAGAGRAAAPGHGGVAMTAAPRRTATVDPGDVAARLSEVRRRIAAAGGGDRRIRIVAVTKGFGPDAVRGGGGRRRPRRGRELRRRAGGQARRPRRRGGRPTPASRWHFLGRVQRNKVQRLAPSVHLWQTVDRAAAGRGDRPPGPGRPGPGPGQRLGRAPEATGATWPTPPRSSTGCGPSSSTSSA